MLFSQNNSKDKSIKWTTDTNNHPENETKSLRLEYQTLYPIYQSLLKKKF